MRIPLFAAAVFLCSSIGLADTSPRTRDCPFSWSRFPVGTWVKYRLKIDGGLEIDYQLTLKERSREEIVLERVFIVAGMKSEDV